MTKIRGYLALVFMCLSLVVLDPVQRFLVAPWVRLFPSRRIPVLTRWQRFMAHLMLGSVRRIGGASIPQVPQIPGREGVLVLMNHQSLLDIPLVVAGLAGSYARIITRKRYLRWIPLISHMVRLYQYPVVDPRANGPEIRKMLAGIGDAARTADVPLAIFPEGTRTRSGELGRFRSTGLKVILKQRPWTVYMMVADGFWQRARFKDFLGGMGEIDGKTSLLGPFEWTDPHGDPEPFVKEMEARMAEALAELRGAAVP